MLQDRTTSRTNADVVYAAAARFRELCLSGESSYLYPGQQIWTEATLKGALAALSAREAAPEGSSFVERLKAQLSEAEAGINVAIADSMVFYYMFPSSDVVKTSTKLHRVREVLSWRGLAAPALLDDKTFGGGVGGVVT